MRNYYIPHKLEIDEITNISDYDAEIIQNLQLYNEGDLIEVESIDAHYVAQIIEITGKSCKVEIQKLLKKKKMLDKDQAKLTLIQSILDPKKFDLVVEKATELGADEIIPLESSYSKVTSKELRGQIDRFRSRANSAIKQSRRVTPIQILNPGRLSKIELKKYSNYVKIALVSEQVETKVFKDEIVKYPNSSNFLVAVGPESGWSSDDLNFLKKSGFEFLSLSGNILRTETAGIAITAIIKFLQNQI